MSTMLRRAVNTYLGCGMVYTGANWVVYGPSFFRSGDASFIDLGSFVTTTIGMGLTWPMIGKYLVFPGKYAIPERSKHNYDLGKPLEYVASRFNDAYFNHMIFAAKPLLMMCVFITHGDATISGSRRFVSEILEEYEKPPSRVQNP